MGFFSVASDTFFIELLEKGGLPALTIGVLMTVFLFLWKSDKKAQNLRSEARDVAFLALQQERISARNREAEQYESLMLAYESIVKNFIDLSRESTRAITLLNEKVGQCPLRSHQPDMFREDGGTI